MIVPHNRLLIWLALVALPAALLGALAPRALGLSLVVIALLAALALLDAVLSPGRLAGLEASLGGVVRLTQDRPGKLDLQFTNAGEKARLLRVGLPFPGEIESPEEEREILLPAGTRHSRFSWPVLPRRRGLYRLPRCYVERLSPMGFWRIRAAFPLESEIRVYPNLLSERRSLALFLLNRGGLGIRRHRQVGKGREFEKLREYIPGDSMSDIHWKATAKRARPITKLFQVERTQEVYLVIDASRLSARPGGGKDGTGGTILDRYLIASLIACLVAERQGDRFGLIVFSDRVHHFIPAKNGRGHYGVCRDAIYALQPRLVTPDFDELFTAIRLKLPKRALLLFLTGLDDASLAEAFQRRLDLVSRRHLILVNMLAPAQARELFSKDAPETAEGGEDLYRRLAGHMVWHELRKLEKTLYRHGVRFSLLSDERLVADLVSRYLNVKQRQIL